MHSVNIGKLAQATVNDSFFTFANLVYSGASVALACILWGALRFDAPMPFDSPEDPTQTPNQGGNTCTSISSPNNPHHHFNFEGVFQRLYLKHRKTEGKDESESRREFMVLPWHKRIHPDIEIEEVEGTLKMLEELYKSVDKTFTTNTSIKQQDHQSS